MWFPWGSFLSIFWILYQFEIRPKAVHRQRWVLMDQHIGCPGRKKLFKKSWQLFQTFLQDAVDYRWNLLNCHSNQYQNGTGQTFEVREDPACGGIRQEQKLKNQSNSSRTFFFRKKLTENIFVFWHWRFPKCIQYKWRSPHSLLFYPKLRFTEKKITHCHTSMMEI